MDPAFKLCLPLSFRVRQATGIGGAIKLQAMNHCVNSFAGLIILRVHRLRQQLEGELGNG